VSTSGAELAITPNIKEQAKARLARIEGQIRGLNRMLDEDRYCVDVLQQISSVHEALRGVGRLMVQNYLENCATTGMRSEDPEDVNRIHQELLDLMYKFAK
jgi:DNA-binding FrmR family transcriptional regulator